MRGLCGRTETGARDLESLRAPDQFALQSSALWRSPAFGRVAWCRTFRRGGAAQWNSRRGGAAQWNKEFEMPAPSHPAASRRLVGALFVGIALAALGGLLAPGLPLIRSRSVA